MINLLFSNKHTLLHKLVSFSSNNKIPSYKQKIQGQLSLGEKKKIILTSHKLILEIKSAIHPNKMKSSYFKKFFSMKNCFVQMKLPLISRWQLNLSMKSLKNELYLKAQSYFSRRYLMTQKIH
jgi:hypothetical protein